jgi:outer membrane protein
MMNNAKNNTIQKYQPMNVRKFLIALNLMLFAIAARAQESAQFSFSLQECLDYAYEHNQNVIVANLEKSAAKARTQEYISAGLPQIEGNASVNRNLILRRSFLPADQFNPTAPKDSLIELAFGRPYDGDIGISLRQMIFDGSFFVGVKAAKTYQQLSYKDHIKSKIDVTESVTKAYYSVLVNEMLFDAVISNYQRLDSLVRDTEIRYQNGFAELLELNRLKVEFNNISTSKDNSERTVDISRALLKYQMGMPVDATLELTEKFDDLKFNIQEDLQQNYSFQRRIEYSILQTNRELAEIDMRNNKARYLPTLDISFAWGINAGADNFGDLGRFGDETIWPDYQLTGLALYVPIFNGGYRTRLLQQNKIQIEQLEYQRQLLENGIKLEVDQYRKTLLNNMAQLQAQQENMGLAESVYQQAKIKYDEGLGSNLEIIDSDNAYKQAQTNYFTALYDALIAHVDYQKALGILKIDE